MQEKQFISNNSETWRELEELSVVINKKGIKSLPSIEVKRFLHLFRQCSHHLSYARTHYPRSSVVPYLNALVGRCHSHIYAVQKASPKQFIKYIFYGFPQLLKEYKGYTISSFGFFAFGMILSFVLVFYNTDHAALFLPSHLIDGIISGQTGGGQWNYPLMSSYIMVNNISIALRAFVFGITLGLGTIYILIYNGMILGSLTGLMYRYGDPVHYWSLILPHGIIELAAVFISGTAGLIIAKSILLPGEYSRRHSLIDGAKKAVPLVIGVVLMLIIAAIIEGFFTPLEISQINKLIFAAMTAIILTIYCSIPYVIKK